MKAKLYPLKNTWYSIGFMLVIGCNAALENPVQPSLTQAAPAVYRPLPSPSANTDSLRYYNAVKNFFERSLSNKNFNGSILVAKDNSVIFEQYVGYKDPLSQKDPLDSESAMHIASVSKTFTSTAILRLVQEGKIRLDESIADFFPNFPYEGITVQMLLTH